MNNSSVAVIMSSLNDKLDGKKITQREKYYIEHFIGFRKTEYLIT